MEEPLKDNADMQEQRALRHDIRNQLSTIQLAVEQLRYEMPDDFADGPFYLDAILTSCTVINTLLKAKD